MGLVAMKKFAQGTVHNAHAKAIGVCKSDAQLQATH